MRIAFVVERPTQFEAPFFRFAAAAREHAFRVYFTAPAAAGPVSDPELGRSVSWGFDLLEGYEHAALPGRKLAAALADLDLVIVNGYTRRAYLRAAFVARRAGVRTALRLDSVRFEGRGAPFWKRSLFGLFLRPLFDRFLATGTLTLEYLEDCGVPRARTGLFPYAIDVEHFRAQARLATSRRKALRAELGIPETARVVLSIAKFSAREAPWDLLRAAALAGNDDVWFLLVGDGPLRAELERFAQPAAASRVRFLGYRPYPELPGLYAAAEVFVHPVREERWGVSVAEAMASGLPVVASSRVGAARDLIASGRNGFTYDAGDARALAERLRAALALDGELVKAENAAILARWDYASAWQGLLQAAGDRA